MILHEERLNQLHPDLAAVVREAAKTTPWDIAVIETLRTRERQQQLVNQGASQTMRSRHLAGPDGLSRAVDIAPAPDGQISWAWPLYHELANYVKDAAGKLEQTVEWGGDWTSFKDGPHWQLPWATYP
jgi:peptidoglycan L-alanyl-D-glutamate endopeptidase CwlK